MCVKFTCTLRKSYCLAQKILDTGNLRKIPCRIRIYSRDINKNLNINIVNVCNSGPALNFYYFIFVSQVISATIFFIIDNYDGFNRVNT